MDGLNFLGYIVGLGLILFGLGYVFMYGFFFLIALAAFPLFWYILIVAGFIAYKLRK